MQDITHNDFKEFLLDYPVKNPSESTILNKYSHIKKFFNVLKKEGHIYKNPFEDLSKEEKLKGFNYILANHTIEPLTENEIKLLLENYKNT